MENTIFPDKVMYNSARALMQGDETVNLYERNLASYEDRIKLHSGVESVFYSCCTKSHNSTLTWSYLPTIPSDWTVCKETQTQPCTINHLETWSKESYVYRSFMVTNQ